MEFRGIGLAQTIKKGILFDLTLVSIIPGVEYGKRYAAVGGDKSDKEVENYVKRIQSLVINDDKKQLADEIRYPIIVNIDGVSTEIADKDEFVKKFDQVFHHKNKQVIENASTKYLFVNWQGIMFGEGNYNMWINSVDSRLKIIAINN